MGSTLPGFSLVVRTGGFRDALTPRCCFLVQPSMQPASTWRATGSGWLRIEFFYFSLMNFNLNGDSWQRYCTVDPRPLRSRSCCLTVGHRAAGGYSALPLPHWWAVRWWGNLPLQVLQGRQFKMWIYSTHKQRILWESLRALHVSSPQSLAAPHLTRPDHSLTMRRASIWQGTVHSRDCNSKYIRSI